MKFVDLLCTITFLLIFQQINVFGQTNFIRQYVRVSPDLELYYMEAGSGTPIIFIPGWIGTSSF
jgi:hypothetical protein